jgi:glycopeptide antibiotics resistance protein
MSPDRGNALRLLVAFVALILYASFYPFVANWARLSHAALYWNSSTAGDRVINVLAYMPLGLLLVASGRGVVSATALGFALSLAVELGQNATRHRNPNGYDLLTNGIGTALGAMLSTRAIHVRIARLRLVELASPAGLLLLLWMALHSAPLIAVIDPDKLHNTFDSRWSWIGIARWSAMWMVFTTAVLRLFRPRWLVPLAAVSLLTPFFFWKQHLSANELFALLPGMLLLRMPRVAWVFAALAVLLPSTREPLYLYWMEAVYLAAGAGWLVAARLIKRPS